MNCEGCGVLFGDLGEGYSCDTFYEDGKVVESITCDICGFTKTHEVLSPACSVNT
jgi:hypothetical protein